MKFSRFSVHTTTVKQSQLVSAKDQTLSPVRIVTGIKYMYWQKISGHCSLGLAYPYPLYSQLTVTIPLKPRKINSITQEQHEGWYTGFLLGIHATLACPGVGRCSLGLSKAFLCLLMHSGWVRGLKVCLGYTVLPKQAKCVGPQIFNICWLKSAA